MNRLEGMGEASSCAPAAASFVPGPAVAVITLVKARRDDTLAAPLVIRGQCDASFDYGYNRVDARCKGGSATKTA